VRAIARVVQGRTQIVCAIAQVVQGRTQIVCAIAQVVQGNERVTAGFISGYRADILSFLV
jgi:hypothetical protein